MRRAVLWTVLVAGLAGALVAATWTTVTVWLDEPMKFKGKVTLHIAPGSAFRDVAAELHHIGVVKRPELLSAYARFTGQAANIKAGLHILEPPLTPRSLLDALVNRAPRRDVKVTFAEGSNIWQVADELAEAGVCGRAEFLEVAAPFEGRLFPDTYYFHKESAPQWVVRALTGKFHEVYEELRKEHPGPYDGGLDDVGIVTLASLVEEEARVDDERPRIARVFFNRLAKGMRLQTDPTCVYSEKAYTQVPTPRHCKDPDNRWSTYVIEGLPPSPISSPGRASLLAAMAPSPAKEDRELLFFVAKQDGTGAHHFSSTFAEHSEAVELHLKRR